MDNLMKKYLTLASSLLLSFGALADNSSIYVGANFTKTDITVSGPFDADKKGKPTLISALSGYNFNEFFAIEGRIGKTLSSGDVSKTDFFYAAEMDVDTFYGLYGKLSLNISDSLKLFAVVGHTKGEFSLTFSNGDKVEFEKESDFSHGFGLNYTISEGSSINVEYMQYFDKENIDVNGISIGYNYHF